ncbi:hypothetical protein E2C01_034201 [Portunus trituberculatus]|uniref:Uncharacterized protein n=1 Tax=Portunus trituberculatus TaxID=210409 RepID=A0A5B7F6B6_PORTR|nr:hypothetical protein [Portunus trituberculatus]
MTHSTASSHTTVLPRITQAPYQTSLRGKSSLHPQGQWWEQSRVSRGLHASPALASVYVVVVVVEVVHPESFTAQAQTSTARHSPRHAQSDACLSQWFSCCPEHNTTPQPITRHCPTHPPHQRDTAQPSPAKVCLAFIYTCQDSLAEEEGRKYCQAWPL